MAERQPSTPHEFLVPGDQVLIGLHVTEDKGEVTRFFSDDQAADAASEEATARAIDLIGAWSDLDWDEMEVALNRIRHESPPSPLIET